MAINNEVKVILDVISEQSSLLMIRYCYFRTFNSSRCFSNIKNNIEALTDYFSKQVIVNENGAKYPGNSKT